MQPEDRDLAGVWDILKAAQLALTFLGGLTRKQLAADAKTYYAILAQFQIIGEATKRLSADFRARHADVPWQDMARMRDVVVHHYDRIDMGILWDTLTIDIPALRTKLEPLLPPRLLE